MSPGTVKVQSFTKMTVLRDSVRLYLGTVSVGKTWLFGGFVGGHSNAPSKGQNLRTVFQVQPVHYFRHVIFDCAFAQKQSRPDFFVGEPIGYQT